MSAVLKVHAPPKLLVINCVAKTLTRYEGRMRMQTAVLKDTTWDELGAMVVTLMRFRTNPAEFA